MDAQFLAVILAAGEGTRMRSYAPKVLHEVGGLAMVGHVIFAIERAGCNRLALIVGAGAERVVSETRGLGIELSAFVQQDQLGTAHAVLAAKQAIVESGSNIIIGYGDMPLVTSESFAAIADCLENGADVAVLGFETKTPTGYGRLLINENQLVAIREEKDANEDERTITQCNSGIIGLCGLQALSLLEAIGNNNLKREYYLTDVVEIARKRGLDVRCVMGVEEEVLGVNNRIELSRAEAIYQTRLRHQFMEKGVTLIAPDTVHFSYDTQIGRDTIIEPNCFFAPGVKIAENVRIKANCYLEGDREKGLFVTIESGSEIGPYARLRPGAALSNGVKVGNFCEVKNAKVGKGTKINHLTYIGDSELGDRCNIGAGTITCNFDGCSKHKTKIGEGAFIGSNTALVAPVDIKAGAYIASGSVVTRNVSKNALAIARARQTDIPQWAKKFREKNSR